MKRIVNTNVFVDYFDSLSKIDEKYQIILSAKVIDKLDYLKIPLIKEEYLENIKINYL